MERDIKLNSHLKFSFIFFVFLLLYTSRIISFEINESLGNQTQALNETKNLTFTEIQVEEINTTVETTTETMQNIKTTDFELEKTTTITTTEEYSGEIITTQPTSEQILTTTMTTPEETLTTTITTTHTTSSIKFPSTTQFDRDELVQLPAEIGKPVFWVSKNQYYLNSGERIVISTSPPYKEETVLSNLEEKYVKKITIKSDVDIHYKNVKAYTDIPEDFLKEGYTVKLYHLLESGRLEITNNPLYNVSLIDKNGNGIVDRIEWFVPELSEQNFELDIDITIINVQSYPTLGGNWTVKFNTIGTADLTITPVNGTEFGEDLEFLELRCGDTILTPQFDGKKIFYPNYSCNETGYEISKVLTPGKHVLEFRFGNDIEYAYNQVGGRSQKTIEYFVVSEDAAIAAGGSLSGVVNVEIPENSPIIRSAWIQVEMLGLSSVASGTVTINLNDSATAPAISVFSDAEALRNRFLANATSSAASVYDITQPGNYSYKISVSFTSINNNDMVSGCGTKLNNKH